MDKTYRSKSLKVRKFSSKMAVETIAAVKDIPVQCEDCGIDNLDMLTIGHPNGNANADTLKYGGSGIQRIINSFPTVVLDEDFRIQCMNCQVEQMYARGETNNERYRNECREQMARIAAGEGM